LHIVRAWREANTLEDAADNINSKLARMERLASSVTFHMMQGSEGAQMLEEYGGRGGRGSSDREPIFGDTGDSIYSDPTGSGGGASGTTQAEKLERARAAVDKLRASYDESYATKLKVADAQEKVNKLIALNPELTGMANSVLQDYIASLDQAEGPLQKIGNTMKDAFGNALMSIVENFNFSANGDDSVKRIIQQEAPKIANYTQQQILDQRRRGGAMKSTFGG